MLAAAQRLRRRAEFTATIRSGRRAGRGVLVAHVLVPASANAAPSSSAPSSSAPPSSGPRVGFVIPRAVGGAVVRNRVRRRLRHLMRERLPALPEGAQIVIRALPQAATRPYGELATDLDAAIAAASRSGPSRLRAEVGHQREE